MEQRQMRLVNLMEFWGLSLTLFSSKCYLDLSMFAWVYLKTVPPKSKTGQDAFAESCESMKHIFD